METSPATAVVSRSETLFTAATRWLVILFIALLVLVIWVSVFTRYVTNNPISWGEQVAKYLVVWAVFLGASLALREGAHIAVNVVVDLCPAAIRRLFAWLATGLTAAFLLVCLYYGVRLVISVKAQTDPLVGDMSLAWPYAAIPVGCAVMLVQMGFVIRGGARSTLSSGQASLS